MKSFVYDRSHKNPPPLKPEITDTNGWRLDYNTEMHGMLKTPLHLPSCATSPLATMCIVVQIFRVSRDPFNHL